jgi:hypothetical protein
MSTTKQVRVRTSGGPEETVRGNVAAMASGNGSPPDGV